MIDMPNWLRLVVIGAVLAAIPVAVGVLRLIEWRERRRAARAAQFELVLPERTIRTPQDAAQSLADEFLRNAAAGANEDNDRFVEAVLAEQRRRQGKRKA